MFLLRIVYITLQYRLALEWMRRRVAHSTVVRGVVSRQCSLIQASPAVYVTIMSAVAAYSLQFTTVPVCHMVAFKGCAGVARTALL